MLSILNIYSGKWTNEPSKMSTPESLEPMSMLLYTVKKYFAHVIKLRILR